MTPLFEPYVEFIPDFPSFQESLESPLPTYIRVNRLKSDPISVLNSLEEKGIRLIQASLGYDNLFLAPHVSLPGNLLEYFLGYIHPQALTSSLVSLILSPREHSSVLDLCAAPGGKTSHCAEMMKNTGLIVSNELYATRHTALGHTLARLGVLNTVITAYQAQEFPLRERFDFVLADVPCSCEGKFRRRAEAPFYRPWPRKETLPLLQKKMILRGFDLLKPGGRMLYATCTYNPAENEGVVDFLLNKRDADLLPVDVEYDVMQGLTQWNGKTYDRRLKRAVRFYPHRVNSVGFFMASIVRRG